MIRSACPTHLWDECKIREAYLRPHTSLDIFSLEGQVPESKVKGEDVDISNIVEYVWYEWVKFRNTAAKLPVSNIQLGRDLGATIDSGPAMACNIMNANGQVMYIKPVRFLKPDESQSPYEQKERKSFDTVIEEKYGLPMTEADFKDARTSLTL
jgi:hypothetical protein